MKRFFLALALTLLPAVASAQCNGTFPNNTVCGNITGSANLPGPTPPSAFQGAAGGSNGQIQYNDSGSLAGATGGDVQMSGTTTLIQPNAVTNGKIAPGAANTMKGSLNGTATSDIALAACAATYQFTKWITGTGWQCATNPVLPSRTAAATVDLSAFTGVNTQGYSAAGDGGGALFYKATGAILTYHIQNAGSCTNGTWPGILLTGGTGKGAYGTITVAGGVATSLDIQGPNSQGLGYTANDVLTASTAGNIPCAVFPTFVVDTVGNAPFQDSSVTNFTVANAGVGCTDGSYAGVYLQATVPGGGGFGDRLQINVDVAGGVIVGTSLGAPGGGYRVGDTLGFTMPNGSLLIPGCSTQPTIQITSISTPRGSFTDTAGNAWQIAADQNSNVLQFGAVPDYNYLGTDGDATDNGPAFRAALEFMAIGKGAPDALGYAGGTMYVPKGGYKICNGIIIYEYTTLRGANFGASMLKQCNSDGASQNFVSLGGPNVRVGNFENKIWDMSLFGGFGSGTAYMIYSNNSQSGDSVQRVAILGVSRGCIKYEIGYGGQSMFGIHSIWCVPSSTYFTGGPSMDLSGNFGFVIDGQSHISGAAAGAAGVRFGDGGTNFVNGLHCEGSITNCIHINGSGSSPPMTTIIGALGPATNLVYIETGTPANFTTVINARPSGAPCTVYTQATASCVKTGNQLGLATY